jgi:hypothetical protein
MHSVLPLLASNYVTYGCGSCQTTPPLLPLQLQLQASQLPIVLPPRTPDFLLIAWLGENAITQPCPLKIDVCSTTLSLPLYVAYRHP